MPEIQFKYKLNTRRYLIEHWFNSYRVMLTYFKPKLFMYFKMIHILRIMIYNE